MPVRVFVTVALIVFVSVCVWDGVLKGLGVPEGVCDGVVEDVV